MDFSVRKPQVFLRLVVLIYHPDSILCGLLSRCEPVYETKLSPVEKFYEQRYKLIRVIVQYAISPFRLVVFVCHAVLWG
jgi:hypothetical protein